MRLKPIQVSGATSSEAAAGVVQFSQAMSLGVLRGQDLKSVMSFMPRVAQAIVDGLNTLNPELRLTIGDLLKKLLDAQVRGEVKDRTEAAELVARARESTENV